MGRSTNVSMVMVSMIIHFLGKRGWKFALVQLVDCIIFIPEPRPLSMSKDLIKKEVPVVGAYGYLDPEYQRTKCLSEKIDVYSFGVVLLEVICDRTKFSLITDGVRLAEWATLCFRNGTLHQNIDPYLQGRITPECFDKFLEIVMRCISDAGDERPSMGEVEVALELALELQKKSNSEMTRLSRTQGKGCANVFMDMFESVDV
ncbi:hypothetical protein V6N12_007597 [Hibiscus sabdariffa]|uniref:Protein kinase domain-containing protein n=1 Tax=Hibiscus sabdariffa TaxID=183260 RepID=A0ABR2F289_9ROSI